MRTSKLKESLQAAAVLVDLINEMVTFDSTDVLWDEIWHKKVKKAAATLSDLAAGDDELESAFLGLVEEIEGQYEKYNRK